MRHAESVVSDAIVKINTLASVVFPVRRKDRGSLF